MAIAFGASLGTVVSAAPAATSLTTSGAASAGSRIFLVTWWQTSTSQTCTGVSGGGLTWVVDRQYNGGLTHNIAVATADAPSGLASSTALTPAFSSGVPTDNGPSIAACYFTGLTAGASGYIDAWATNKVTFGATAWSSNNVTTTNANDLIFVFAEGNGGGTTTPNGVTTEIHDWGSSASENLTTGYRIVSSTAAYGLGGTWTGAADQLIMCGAYKASAAPTEHFGASAVPLTFGVDINGQVVTEPPTLRVVSAARVGR